MQNFAGLIKQAQIDKKNIDNGQMSLFDMPGIADPASADQMVEVKEFPKLELLAMEKEVLNTYMTGHPLEEYKSIMNNYNFNLGQILPLLENNTADEDEEMEQADFGGVEEEDEKAAEIKEIKNRYNNAKVKLMGLLESTAKKTIENKKTQELMNNSRASFKMILSLK